MFDFILQHLPALQVIIPLLAAPICLILGAPRLAWLFATLVSWTSFALSLLILQQVSDGSTLSYVFGNWPAPWGITYEVDQLNALVTLIISAMAAIMLPYSWTSIQAEIPKSQQTLFFTALLLCIAGLLGITLTGDAFNLFVLLEISSLSTYTLIALGKDRRALLASFQYLIMGTIGATFLLIGIGLLYMITGTLNMADLATRLPELHQSRTLQGAFAFIVVGIGLKLAMFPLHLWLPNAYTYSPSVVSAFLAATATKVAVYALIRFLFSVFGVEFSFQIIQVQWWLIPLGLMAAVITSLVAIFQQDIKRMLAYSSVAQIGYMLVGIAMLNVTGLAASLLHLFNHALMKGALFLLLGAIAYRLSATRLENITGLGRMMPWTMSAFVIGGLSIIGVPLTVGFISKWYLILASIENGWWWVTVLILASSLLAIVYMGRVIEYAWVRERPVNAKAVSEAPLSLLIPAWILILANIYFGIDTSFTTGIAEAAAKTLLEGRS